MPQIRRNARKKYIYRRELPHQDQLDLVVGTLKIHELIFLVPQFNCIVLAFCNVATALSSKHFFKLLSGANQLVNL